VGKVFVFIICLEQIFLGTTKFGGSKQNCGGALLPNARPVVTGLVKIGIIFS